MLLVFHISIAFISMAFVAFAYVLPSRRKLYTAHALAAATLVSGTILTIQNPSHLMQACIVGLIYMALVYTAIYAVQRKFAHILTNA